LPRRATLCHSLWRSPSG